MDKVLIKTEIPVVVVVTDNFKHKLTFELQEKIRKLDLELQQLDFTSRRTLMEAERLGQLPQVQKQVDADRQKRLEHKQQLLDQIKLVVRLKPGDEILQGHVESMQEVKVGDNWNETRNIKIVIKDDQVVEIRRD